MNVTGMLYGSRMLAHVDFPTSEVLGPDATERSDPGPHRPPQAHLHQAAVQGRRRQEGQVRAHRQGIGFADALAEKERLYFVEHRHGNAIAKANGVTFEGGVPARARGLFRHHQLDRVPAPAMTLTHMGGVDIEELDRGQVAQVPFEALTGLKAFVVANALSDIGAPKEIISPLVQHLPKLWELVHHYGMTTLELNPIRMRPGREGRLTPVACDFKCGFDRDDPRWQRLALPDHLFTADNSRIRARGRSAAHAPGPVGRVRHQSPGHDPRADIRGRGELAGHGSAR